MKLLLPLFALSLLAACSTSSRRDVWAPAQPMKTSDPNATRRDLYSPNPTTGHYTNALENGAWKQYGKTVDQQMNERQEMDRLNRAYNRTAPVSSEPAPAVSAPAPAPSAPAPASDVPPL